MRVKTIIKLVVTALALASLVVLTVKLTKSEKFAEKKVVRFELGEDANQTECVGVCTSCGVPDGCGGTCSCADGLECQSNGICKPIACEPVCRDDQCGGNDGCGGTCQNTCKQGSHCDSVSGLCKPDCVPNCDGNRCGFDGCGGVCSNTCGGGSVCHGGFCSVPTLDKWSDWSIAWYFNCGGSNTEACPDGCGSHSYSPVNDPYSECTFCIHSDQNGQPIRASCSQRAKIFHDAAGVAKISLSLVPWSNQEWPTFDLLQEGSDENTFRIPVGPNTVIILHRDSAGYSTISGESSISASMRPLKQGSSM